MSTIEKIALRENKTLKLNNVLVREVHQNELMNVDKLIHMMESHIKARGNAVVGPMINYSTAVVNENGQVEIILKLMVQLRNPMHNIEAPYKFIKEIKASNCLFARFMEKEENLQYAYSKLQLYAFENDIKLKGDSYTVFVERRENGMVADVFMETKKEDLTPHGI